jgi:hypothetical protein
VLANTCAGNGGGLNLFNSGVKLIIESTIRNNSSSGEGGGLRSANGALEVVGSNISGNHAATGGGASIISGSARFVNSIMNFNVASLAGGGISSPVVLAYLQGSDVSSNTAPTDPDLNGLISVL